jgi:hypothetical protein
MDEVANSAQHVIETLFVAGFVALVSYVVAIYRSNHRKEKERDKKLDKLLEFHEGVPADKFLGQPAIMGLHERLQKQDILNEQLATTQREILDLVHTGNGRTIGQKVDNIVHVAEDAKVVGQEALQRANEVKEIVETSLALHHAHVDDSKKVIKIGILNDEAEREALAQQGIILPDYEYPPESTVFSLDELRANDDKKE